MCGDAHSCTRHSGHRAAPDIVGSCRDVACNVSTTTDDVPRRGAIVRFTDSIPCDVGPVPKGRLVGIDYPFLQIRRHELGWTERDPRFCLAAALLGSHHPRRTIPAGNPASTSTTIQPAGSWNDRIRRRFGCNRSRRCSATSTTKARIPFAELDASVQGWINHVRYGDTWGLRTALLARRRVPRAEEDGQRIEQRISGID